MYSYETNGETFTYILFSTNICEIRVTAWVDPEYFVMVEGAGVCVKETFSHLRLKMGVRTP